MTNLGQSLLAGARLLAGCEVDPELNSTSHNEALGAEEQMETLMLTKLGYVPPPAFSRPSAPSQTMRPPRPAVRSSAFVLSLLATLAAGCAFAPEDADGEETVTSEVAGLTAEEKLGLAMRFAPVFFQDIDDSNAKADYLTKFNFDGDYVGVNNWANLDNFTTVPAHVYWSLSETTTHYFIGYYTFHPRDWLDHVSVMGAGYHENDLEGVMLAVKKTSAGGQVVGMISEAHGDLNSYALPGTTAGSTGLSTPLSFQGGTHPRVFIEAKGHGVVACDAAKCSTVNDRVVYVVASAPQSPNPDVDSWTQTVGYGLISMDATTGDRGFWAMRDEICSNCTFGSWGKIRGINGKGTDNASGPWTWDDAEDGESDTGDFLCDPALMFDVRMNGPEFDSGFSHTYVDHQYRTQTLRIDAVRSDSNEDNFGGGSDIYLSVSAPGAGNGRDALVSEGVWKKNNAAVGTWNTFLYGGADAPGQRRYGSPVNSHSFCRQATGGVRVAVKDSDSGGDDSMGEVVLTGTGIQEIDLGKASVRLRLTSHRQPDASVADGTLDSSVGGTVSP